jgi:hypothetical protein
MLETSAAFKASSTSEKFCLNPQSQLLLREDAPTYDILQHSHSSSEGQATQVVGDKSNTVTLAGHIHTDRALPNCLAD